MSVAAESLSSHDTKPLETGTPVSLIGSAGTQPLHNIFAIDTNNKALAKTVGPDDLPSKRLRNSQWHELKRTEVKGSQLKAPRVRKGPPDHYSHFSELVDEDDEKIHHDLEGRSRKKHRDETENWETAKIASFTRQEMQHGYQKDSLGRILGRLKSVVYLNLHDNEITNLSPYSFPRCEYINMDQNYMTSITQFPSLSRVVYLTARSNGINSLSGLSKLSSCPLEELTLAENPVAFNIGYRYKVFSILPKLKVLDGVLKQPEDCIAPSNIPDELQDRCTIL